MDKKSELNKKFDMVLIEKPGAEGLSKKEFSKIMDMVNENMVYPIEIYARRHASSSMGIITTTAAAKLEYEYGPESDLSFFIASILDDMDKESPDNIYHFKGVSIWLGRM